MTEKRKGRRQSMGEALRALTLVVQLGISMLTCIFLCGAIGLFLTRRTGILFVFPLFLVLGCLAGFRSCYRLITRACSLKNPKRRDREIRGDYDDKEME